MYGETSPSPLRLTHSSALALFTHLHDAVLLLDGDGAVCDANPAAQWLGQDGSFPSFGEMTGIPWTDSAHLPVGGGPVWDRRLRLTAASGASKLMHATVIAVPAQGALPVRCLCLLHDVQPDLQAAVAQQQAVSRAHIAGNAAVMVWMADATMQLDWFNNAWLAFTGRTLCQMLAHGWLSVVHPDDHERCLGIHAVSAQAQTPFTLDMRLRRHDGAYRWVLVTGMPRPPESGAFEGYIGSCLDIHERRQTEDKLADRTRALRLLDGQREGFLATLSHGLRNPLAPIANAAALLRRHEGHNPPLVMVREIIERQVEQLRLLATGLEDASRLAQGDTLPQRQRAEHALPVPGHALDALHGQCMLLIDDNADMRDSLRMLLEAADNQVRCAADGDEALALLDSFVPQVVVCDIGLPGLNGYQLVPLLRQKLAGQPVLFVALSGHGREVDQNQALESGFDAFQTKPLRPAQPMSLQ